MVILSWLIASWVLAAEPPTPAHTVKDLVQAISSIKPSDTAAVTAQNTAATEKANSILDIPGVSQRILGRHWKKRTPSEQQEFTALLTQLFTQVAYPKTAKFFSDLEVSIKEERVTGERAVVSTTVSDPEEGLISVDYKLQRHESNWRVRDIVLDDVSLTRNLRSQCQKILTEKSYPELLRRMRDKLNEESL